MIKEIKNKLFNKLWKKCLITFLIIFLIVFCIGFVSITSLDGLITTNNIHSEVIVVDDKFYDDNLSDSYVIVSNGKNYTILKNGHEREVFEIFDLGQQYKLIVSEPQSSDSSAKIIQVSNVTS